MNANITRFCTYEHPTEGTISAMTEAEFFAGGRELVENAGEYVWQYAPDAETAVAQHLHKHAHWESDVREGRAELNTY